MSPASSTRKSKRTLTDRELEVILIAVFLLVAGGLWALFTNLGFL